MGQKMPVVRIDLSSVPSRPTWFTVVTKYNYEKKVANDIMQGLKNTELENYIFETVVPIEEIPFTKTSKSGKTEVKFKEEKIYPLYVFVKCTMNERVWDYLRTTPGVATVLAYGGCPSIVQEHEIMEIKKMCGLLEKEKEVKKENAKNFTGKPGNRVKIIDGIFEGLYATIKLVETSKAKCAVNLENNGMNVEIDIVDLELM